MRTWLPTTVRSWHECWPFRTRLYCLIVAGRNNDLRTLYSHWTGQIRKSRLGVLLVPDADYDGDLLGVRLPRHPAVTMSEARGYGCQNGAITLIQGVRVNTEEHR